MRTRRPAKFTPAVRAAYVEALARLASHKAAAAHVGVAYCTAWKWRKKDPELEAECENALGQAYGELLTVARKLAIEGLVIETLDKAGNVIKTERRYSERILLRMLARLDPAGWSDKLQVDSKSTVEVHDKRIKVEAMTPSQRRAARRFLETIPEDPSRN